MQIEWVRSSRTVIDKGGAWYWVQQVGLKDGRVGALCYPVNDDELAELTYEPSDFGDVMQLAVSFLEGLDDDA